MVRTKQATCFLCGEYLTAPKFYGGHTYGWSCITKVNPSAKKETKPEFWVKCESVKYFDNEGNETDYQSACKVVVTYNNNEYQTEWLNSISGKKINRSLSIEITLEGEVFLNLGSHVWLNSIALRYGKGKEVFKPEDKSAFFHIYPKIKSYAIKNKINLNSRELNITGNI